MSAYVGLSEQIFRLGHWVHLQFGRLPERLTGDCTPESSI